MTLDSAVTGEAASHQALIEAVLPSWLTAAAPALREAYFASSLLSVRSSADAAQVSARLQTPAAFCAPLLQAALQKAYPTLALDVNKHELIRMVRTRDGLTTQLTPRHQTLLEAALQNFLPAEARPGGLEEGTVILPVGVFGFTLNDDGSLVYRYPDSARVKLEVHDFAALVRTLDLGRQYQAYFKAVFRPLGQAPSEDLEQAETAGRFNLAIRDHLDAAAVTARIRGHISEAAYRAVKQITQPRDLQPASWEGKSLRFCQLGLLHTPLTTGYSLLGMVLIEQVNGSACLAYMPGEPTHALREYASRQAFADTLREKLREVPYRDYFGRFVAQRSQAAFTERLVNTLSPVPWIVPGQFVKPPVPDPDADIGLRVYPVEGKLVHLLYSQQLIKLGETVRLAVVPTDDEDQLAREQRVAWWEGVLASAFDIATFVVPGAGELALAVGAVELVKDLCLGVDDWKHGQTVEAISQFGAVAQNVALLASGAAASIALVHSPFMEALVPVIDSAGKPRLLNPDLTAYATDISLPADAMPNAPGQYRFNDRTYVRIDQHYYQHVQDETSGQWVIDHPRLRDTYRPVLTHNKAGAWQHVHEQPLQWQGAQLLRRFGAITDRLSDAELLQVNDACGISPEQLREAHVNRQQAPVLLQDALLRYRARRDVERLVTQVRQAQPPGEGAAYCLPLLQRVAGWPQSWTLRVVAEDGHAVQYGAGHAEPIVVQRSDWLAGTLCERIVEQLDDTQKQRLFPDSVENTVQGQSSALAQALAGQVQAASADIADGLYAHQEPELTKEAAPIKRLFPGLSGRAANDLAAQALDWELSQLRGSGRLSVRLTEQARLYLREQRLNRACEGLIDPAFACEDRDTLALGLLAQLPGWTGHTRIELHAGYLQGRTLATVGSEAASEVKYLVSQDGQYQAFDALEQALGGQQDVFAALCSALPDVELKALSLSRHDSQGLRTRLSAQAASDRTRAGLLLGQRVIQPWFKLPQLTEQGAGYTLSGRAEASWGQRRRLRALYPSLSYRDMAALRDVLRRPGESFELAIQRLEQEYRVLDSSLEQWSRALPEFAVARAEARNRLLRAWRGETRRVNLSGRTLGELPLVTADFSHIVELKMERMQLSADPSFFLSRFPRLQKLSLGQNFLRAIPSQVKELTALTHLDLQLNVMEPVPDVFAELAKDDSSVIQVLNMDRVCVSTIVDGREQPLLLGEQAMTSLSRLKQLRSLVLANNAFSLDDRGMAILGRMNQLEELSLKNTLMSLTDQGRQALSRLTRLRSLNLSFNELGQAPDVARMRMLEKLILQSTGLTQWPEGLSFLMNRHATPLRWINLSDNNLTELPDLAETTYVTMMRSFILREQFHINLDRNPLSELSRRRLRRARIDFQTGDRNTASSAQNQTSNAWLTDCPHDLRASIEADQNTPEAAAFYRVMARLTSTDAYKRHPEPFKARIWSVMRAVVADAQAPGDGLGAGDLREQLFEHATLVDGSCGDGMSIVLDYFETRTLAWQAASSAMAGGEAMLRPLLGLGRQLYRAALVDEYAAAITQGRLNRRTALILEALEIPALHPMDQITDAQLLDGNPDEVEIRLLLRNRLQARLALRAQPSMLYSEILSTETTRQVGNAVLTDETASGMLDWLAEQPFWSLYLRRVYPQRFEAVESLWGSVLIHFEEARTLDPFSVEQDTLATVLKALSDLAPETRWAGVQGEPLRVVMTDQAALEMYASISTGRTKATQRLIRTLSEEVTAANVA